jgi:transporter family-2 protein
VPAALVVLAVVGSGALLGLQARINGELGARVSSALAAATVSFLGGTVALAAVVAVWPSHRRAVRRLLTSRTRWWWWLGGPVGAAIVAATAVGVPKVGVALVTVCVVAGAAVGALVVDRVGLGPAGRQAVTPVRVAGAVLAIAAVTYGAVGDRHASFRPLLLTVLVVFGAGTALQQASNGRLWSGSDSATVTALASFLVGTLLLVVVAAAAGEIGGRRWPRSWWLYTGGLQGAVFIAVTAVAVHRIGVLVVSLATVAGQLAAAVVLDVVWPSPGTELRAQSVVGAVATLAAVVVVALARHPPPAGGDHDVADVTTS